MLNRQMAHSISTQVLEMAKEHQKGRVEHNSTNVEFNFTEQIGQNVPSAKVVVVTITTSKKQPT